MPTPAPTQAKIAQTPVAPAAPAPSALPGQITSISVLEEQVISYSQQLAGLTAQRRILQRQISVSTDGATRAALELKRVPLENQIAQTEIDLASARAQLTARQTTQIGVPIRNFPPMNQRRGPDPDLIVGLAFAFIFAVMMPISIAIARRIWRGVKPVAAARTEDVTPRFDRLEQAVDAIAIEVERISEGQRFVTRVLTERPGTVRQQAAPEHNGDVAGLGEAKPFLALGAGPIEPIRMAERQAVRQSITPH
jgi:hypothetical protein